MNLDQIELDDRKQGVRSRSVLTNRRFLTCPECGWVHYVMATAEKLATDLMVERYHLNEVERHIYESALQQCLRCEALARAFRAAHKADLARAAGHLVTPVFVEAEVGTQ